MNWTTFLIQQNNKANQLETHGDNKLNWISNLILVAWTLITGIKGMAIAVIIEQWLNWTIIAIISDQQLNEQQSELDSAILDQNEQHDISSYN